MMILGFAVSMAMVAPFMGLIFGMLPPLTSATAKILTNIGTVPFLVSLITEDVRFLLQCPVYGGDCFDAY
jgi:uncharacterized membrane protein YtjA (UPF0391 family)